MSKRGAILLVALSPLLTFAMLVVASSDAHAHGGCHNYRIPGGPNQPPGEGGPASLPPPPPPPSAVVRTRPIVPLRERITIAVSRPNSDHGRLLSVARTEPRAEQPTRDEAQPASTQHFTWLLDCAGFAAVGLILALLARGAWMPRA